ncbi:unnamed protein product, partial [Adineta steineri]
MGGRNARAQKNDIANYGAGYNSSNGYGEIENYGSVYQPGGGGYPIGYGFTDGPFVTSVKPPLGGLGSLGGYGSLYPAGFNPAIQGGFGGPKIRQICVPNHIVGVFQNLLQQGGCVGAPQMMPQQHCAPQPMMPQQHCAPPPMMPQMPCAPPPM